MRLQLAGDSDSRKFVFGCCFSIGSGAISWSSKKQATLALSPTEAENKAACTTTCEVVKQTVNQLSPSRPDDPSSSIVNIILN